MEPLFYFKKINFKIMKKGYLLFVVLLFVQLSNAQIFKDFGTKLEDRAKRKVEQKVDEKIDALHSREREPEFQEHNY